MIAVQTCACGVVLAHLFRDSLQFQCQVLDALAKLIQPVVDPGAMLTHEYLLKTDAGQFRKASHSDPRTGHLVGFVFLGRKTKTNHLVPSTHGCIHAGCAPRTVVEPGNAVPALGFGQATAIFVTRPSLCNTAGELDGSSEITTTPVRVST